MASRAPSLMKPFIPSTELRRVAYTACQSAVSWSQAWEYLAPASGGKGH
ncbi:MAG TPA: hypothetical protein VFC03_18465 [Acidimicrobiales bacterium]|nr:hypothetical protein [Acidimicrobiales bacterium]